MTRMESILSDAGVDAAKMRPMLATELGTVMAVITKGGEAAIELWHQLRHATEETGYWPVLLGAPDETDDLVDWQELRTGLADQTTMRLAFKKFILPKRPSVRKTLDAAKAIDMVAWFVARWQERIEEMQEYANEGDDLSGLDVPEGDWPDDATPNTKYSTPFEVLTHAAHKEMALALVPTKVAWEVPAFLKWGGWNECPIVAEQCAAMRYWHQKFGAEPVALTSSIAEMHVARPPVDQETALSLAREQYLYCNDIVTQGCQTISDLGATLLRGTSWYFWWD